MEPVSALALACFVSWCLAAMDQAKAEVRTAASAIRDDLHRRQDAWAKQVADRLANGRKGGPSTALWWGWAAFRTAKAVRQAMRKEPRDAEKARAIRDTSGPFRRIWEAGRRGARFAADEARRQRDAQEKQARVPVGVCGRCGAVVARAALVWATTMSGTQEQMCAKCRADIAAQRAAQEPTREADRSSPDVTDADVVGDQAAIKRPRPEIDAPPDRPAEPPRPQAPPAAPTPDTPPSAREVEAHTPRTAPTADRVNTAPAIEGEPMAPRQPGQVVPRAHTPARTSGGNGGESYTHGQFNRATADIKRRLEELPAVLEAMLQRLTVADAGRTQVQGVLLLREHIIAWMAQVNAMLADVNRRERPILTAVEAAGGPDEIAGIRYLSEV